MSSLETSAQAGRQADKNFIPTGFLGPSFQEAYGRLLNDDGHSRGLILQSSRLRQPLPAFGLLPIYTACTAIDGFLDLLFSTSFLTLLVCPGTARSGAFN